MARQIVLTVTAVLTAATTFAAPSTKQERKIDATARKVTRSVMIGHDGRTEAFVFNTDLTTCTTKPPMLEACAPPFANILTDPKTNFLPCRGGPFALCYYSGPDGTLPCTVRRAKEGTFAECKCIEVPYGPYFVDVHAIMDKQTYDQTVAVCGKDGQHCTDTNSAPACQVINTRKLIPGADMISVFSFNCVPSEGIAQIPCDTGVYAGCMTAPCYREKGDEKGIVTCECPLYEGCYEVGTPPPIGTCDLPSGTVWSSAHNATLTCPPSSTPPSCQDATYPRPRDGGPSCIPDVPSGTVNSCGEQVACPLYPAGLTDEQLAALRASSQCADVCNEYLLCGAQDPNGASGLQFGYTCDSVLCTSRCASDGSFQDDLLLTEQACAGLPACASSPGIQAIMKLEALVGCSCCASQVCACTGQNAETAAAIYDLNVAQCARGITPQCCINGTLCGQKNGQPFACQNGACPG